MLTNTLNSITNLFKKTFYKIYQKIGTIIIIIIIAAAGVYTYMYFFTSKVVEDTTTVKIQQLKQYVEVTGSVQASLDANLSFQTLGAVSFVGVKVGDIVSEGKVLATLQSGDAQASLLQAQAQLASAKATLGQLTQGFRKEEIAIKQQAVDNAKSSLEGSYSSIPDTIRNVDATTADIVKNKLNSLFINNGYNYTLSFSSCNQSLQSSIEMSRSKLEKILSEYQNKSSTISILSSTDTIDNVFEQAYLVTVATNELVDSISSLLLLSCSSQNLFLDPIRVTLSAVRITINSLFLDITSKRNTLNVTKNAESQAIRDLDLTKAGTDPYKLKAQFATVSQAEAQVAAAQSSLQKTKIVAPFSGTISDIFISEGETVTSGKTVISMFASDAFEIEAKVPEIDIIKVKIGSEVEVTLDAYGKAVNFPAKVTRVNPTAILEGGVPMYKVVITFLDKDLRIKSGMTANVNIVTENKPQALVLEARFVEVIDQSHGLVTVRKGKIDTKEEIILGFRGQDGLIEIISGLVPEDLIVSPSTLVRSAQKQTN